jgi:hypothetical protein
MLAGDLSATPVKQDLVGSCSVVASLCVLAEHERKFGSGLVTSRIHPQDSTGRWVLVRVMIARRLLEVQLYVGDLKWAPVGFKLCA